MGIFEDWFNPGQKPAHTVAGIPGHISQYYNPYIQSGQGTIPNLQAQYGNLMNDPGGFVNKIGAGYHQSPGFQFALQQALGGAGHAAAAGGMAGSPEHEMQNQQIATGMADQDYNNWLNKAMGAYGQGLAGEQGMWQGGLQAGGDLASQIAQAMSQQGAYQYQGNLGQNQALSSLGSYGLGAAKYFMGS